MAVKMGYKRVHTILVAAIQLAMESLNLGNSLNAAQIFDLSDTLIDSSHDDYLSIQDIILFLQKLVRGEMGTLYSQMDIAKFMELLESYRNERHISFMAIKEEQHSQSKISGKDVPRRTVSPGNISNEDASILSFSDHLQVYHERGKDNA